MSWRPPWKTMACALPHAHQLDTVPASPRGGIIVKRRAARIILPGFYGYGGAALQHGSRDAPAGDSVAALSRLATRCVFPRSSAGNPWDSLSESSEHIY